MNRDETQVEALERRVRYAAAHPIEGLLTTEQLAEIRAADEAWPDNGSSRGGMVTLSRQRRALLRHIDALERRRPMAPYERGT